MKSKSPSAASKKSTLKSSPVARCFHVRHSLGERGSPRPQCRIHSPRSRAKAPRYFASLAALTLFSFLAACSQVPDTPPPLTNTILASHSETLRIQTPSAGWNLKLLSVHATDQGYLCVSQLLPPSGMSASVISEVELTFTIDEPASPQQFHHYILGKTWNWNGNPELTFIDSLDEIKDALADARSVPFTTP